MNNQPIDLPEIEPGEPNFNTFDEIFHDIYAECGEPALREFVDLFPELTCESLEDAAQALRQAGKPSIAAIVMETAPDRPSSIDLDNPYPPSIRNWLYWRNTWFKKRSRITGEPEAELRRRYDKKKRKH